MQADGFLDLSTTLVAPTSAAGRLDPGELRAVDEALGLILGL